MGGSIRRRNASSRDGPRTIAVNPGMPPGVVRTWPASRYSTWAPAPRPAAQVGQRRLIPLGGRVGQDVEDVAARGARRELELERGPQRGEPGPQASGERVRPMLAPGQPDLAHGEPPESLRAAQEPGDVILVGVRRDHHREPAAGLRLEVVEDPVERPDVAAVVDPAVDQDVVRTREGDQEAVAEADAVHPYPDLGIVRRPAAPLPARHDHSPRCSAARLARARTRPR